MTDCEADLSDIRALQAGDERALDRLMARHKHPLYRFICGQVRDAEDAQEILADTFVRVYQKRDQFFPTGRFSSWLYRIALNLCRDCCRKRLRSALGLAFSLELFSNGESISTLPDSRPDPMGNAASREAIEQLEELIGALPSKLKTAFVLHLVEQRPQAECAELLGVSVKTIETRVYRARRMLCATLERRERSEHLLSTTLAAPAR